MRILTAVALACAGIGIAGSALAQGTARSQDIDTSIRAAGMGGADVAVTWGDFSVWGNPSLLGRVNGMRFERGRTQLVPGLASDVWFKSDRWLVGGAGLGLSLMGRPFDGVGHTRLDYGTSVGTDDQGNPIGVFSSYEEVHGWGAGVSLADLVGALNAWRGHPSGPPAWDLAFGFQDKHTTVALAPNAPAEARCTDWGGLASISLLAFNPSARDRFALDLSGAYSILNANDNLFDFGAGETSPASRIRRAGFAVHGAVRAPWAGAMPHGLAGVFLSGFSTLAEGGVAFDHEHVTAGSQPPSYDADRAGFELTVFGVATLRTGHVTDRAGEIDGETDGYGVRLPIGRWASVAWDEARVPQARNSGLPDVHRHGWSASVDPAAVVRDLVARP